MAAAERGGGAQASTNSRDPGLANTDAHPATSAAHVAPHGGVAATSPMPLDRVWKRNARLVYLTNFVHMTMMTLCLGSVWDIFIYNVSQDQYVLQTDAVSIGSGVASIAPVPLETFSAFELTFDIRPSMSTPTQARPGCVATYTCDAAILRITDGSGDCCQVGNRVPALFFSNGTTRLHVMMDSPGQPTSDRRSYDASQMCWSHGDLARGVWSHIKVKQSNSDVSKGQYSSKHGALVLYVNGVKVCEINGTYAAPVPPLKEAQLVMGTLPEPLVDLHNPARADIRNVKYGKPASNVFVGAVNSVQGMTAVIIMYPIGWLGDYANRYRLLRLNFIVGLASAAILILAVDWAKPSLLFIGVIVWSIYQQCLSSTIYTVLTDNVRRGERRTAAGNYKTLSALAMSFGPAIQLGVIFLGPAPDSWTTRAFEVLLLPGWLLLPFVGMALFAVKPVGSRFGALPNVDDEPPPLANNSATTASSAAPLLQAPGLTPRASEQLSYNVVAVASPPANSSAIPSPPHATGSARQGRHETKNSRDTMTNSWLNEPVAGPLHLRRRFAVALSAQIFFIGTLLANGMTVRYFNLYYTEVLHFNPAQLCILNAICRLWIAAFVQLSSPLARIVGRTNLCLIFHLLSAVFTLGIYGGGIMEPPLWLSCFSFLLRYGFLQARDPLLYSITMDIVPEEQRSRWASLNSLRTLSFSGSALIGGFLADTHGYETSFTITVIALVASTVLFLPAWIYFPRQECRTGDAEEEHVEHSILFEQTTSSVVAEPIASTVDERNAPVVSDAGPSCKPSRPAVCGSGSGSSSTTESSNAESSCRSSTPRLDDSSNASANASVHRLGDCGGSTNAVVEK